MLLCLCLLHLVLCYCFYGFLICLFVLHGWFGCLGWLRLFLCLRWVGFVAVWFYWRIRRCIVPVYGCLLASFIGFCAFIVGLFVGFSDMGCGVLCFVLVVLGCLR